jgi:hypothetical protein
MEGSGIYLSTLLPFFYLKKFFGSPGVGGGRNQAN